MMNFGFYRYLNNFCCYFVKSIVAFSCVAFIACYGPFFYYGFLFLCGLIVPYGWGFANYFFICVNIVFKYLLSFFTIFDHANTPFFSGILDWALRPFFLLFSFVMWMPYISAMFFKSLVYWCFFVIFCLEYGFISALEFVYEVVRIFYFWWDSFDYPYVRKSKGLQIYPIFGFGPAVSQDVAGGDSIVGALFFFHEIFFMVPVTLFHAVWVVVGFIVVDFVWVFFDFLYFLLYVCHNVLVSIESNFVFVYDSYIEIKGVLFLVFAFVIGWVFCYIVVRIVSYTFPYFWLISRFNIYYLFIQMFTKNFLVFKSFKSAPVSYLGKFVQFIANFYYFAVYNAKLWRSLFKLAIEVWIILCFLLIILG